MISCFAIYEKPRRDKEPVTVILLDLGNLKVINDVHGHAVGDKVLFALAGVISNCRRYEAAVAQYRGPELLFHYCHHSRRRTFTGNDCAMSIIVARGHFPIYVYTHLYQRFTANAVHQNEGIYPWTIRLS